MGNKLRIMLLVFVVFSLILFVGYRLNQVRVIECDTEGVSPFPSAFTLNANVYYLNSSSKLENERKTLVITSNQIVEALFEALKSKPTLNYSYPLIDQSVQIISYEIVDSKLYLNLSSDILTTTYWSRGYHTEIIYAIVNTMTQFDTIERVQIRIAGKDIKTYVEDDINYNNLIYNESFNQRPRMSADVILNQFLNHIYSGNYEEAFKLTTSNRKDMPEAFVDDMDSYVCETKNLERGDMLSLEEDGFLNISVNYEVYDTEEQKYQIVKVKYWQAYENAGKYYIYWR